MREIDQFTLSSISRKIAGADLNKVSVCILAKNEQERLPTCIASAREFADEIIVVDRGSKDRTVEVAREQGAKVFFFPLNTDFARIRNFALNLALYNWVLFLEPGDRLRFRSTNKQQVLLTDTDIWLCQIIDLVGSAADKSGANLQPRLFKRSVVTGYRGDGCEDLEYTTGFKAKVSDLLYIEHGQGNPFDRKVIDIIYQQKQYNCPIVSGIYCNTFS